MIKALDVFVDLVVSTMLKWLRARDGVGTVGSLSCGVVVLKGNMSNVLRVEHFGMIRLDNSRF